MAPAANSKWVTALRLWPAVLRPFAALKMLRPDGGAATALRACARLSSGHEVSTPKRAQLKNKRGRRLVDQSAVRPDGGGGKLEMGNRAAAGAGGIAAVRRAEDAAAGWRGERPQY